MLTAARRPPSHRVGTHPRQRSALLFARLVAVGLSVAAVRPAGASLSSLLVPRPAPNAPVTLLAAPFEEELRRSISRGTDFQATSTTPGYTYRFNPELDVFERTTSTLGPAFLERADTIGQGKVDLGVSFLWVHFTENDGESLDGLQETVLFDVANGLGADAATITYEKFDLTQRALYFSGTYGVLP